MQMRVLKNSAISLAGSQTGLDFPAYANYGVRNYSLSIGCQSANKSVWNYHL